MKKIFLGVIVLFLSNQLSAQDYKFGKVSKKELQEKFYAQDSSVNAVVLYKKRRTYFKYSTSQGWTLKTEVNERIKIYNKEGYKWASKKINLYIRNEDEKVSIKANTFNLINNKVQKTKLEKKEIFLENNNKYWKSKNFTMPNLKEGSIVEWEYTINSPYYWKIDDMVFQYEIPIKQIVSKVEIPEYFKFKNQSQGYFPIDIVRNIKKSSVVLQTKSRGDQLSGTRTTFKQNKIDFKTHIISCTIDHVPAIKNEPFINNLNNYKTLLKFELSTTKFPNSIVKNYSTSWEDVTKTIYKSSNFGEQLKKSSHFREDLFEKVNLSSPNLKKISEILSFAKSKMKWNGYKGKYTSQGVKKAYKEGVGNTAEINLTLVAMLREAGIKANPVLVSTRENGIPLFATTDGFNYVIACIELENEIILLDATEEYSTINNLPLRVLNWKGRIVRENGSSDWVSLMSKRPASSNSMMQLVMDEDGVIEGMKRTQLLNLKAINYRNKNSKIKEEDVILKVEEDHGGIEISDFKLSNKNSISKPIVEMFKFSSEDMVEIIGNKIYFKPLFFEAITENPFKLEKRQYPIDFGTPFSNKDLVNIIIPKGYIVESIPEKLAIALPNNYGVYRFSVKVVGDVISVLSKIEMNTAVYPIERYKEIKEFYKMIINKNLEQIILKKVS